jgi:hypothetical protein
MRLNLQVTGAARNLLGKTGRMGGGGMPPLKLLRLHRQLGWPVFHRLRRQRSARSLPGMQGCEAAHSVRNFQFVPLHLEHSKKRAGGCQLIKECQVTILKQLTR